MITLESKHLTLCHKFEAAAGDISTFHVPDILKVILFKPQNKFRGVSPHLEDDKTETAIKYLALHTYSYYRELYVLKLKFLTCKSGVCLFVFLLFFSSLWRMSCNRKGKYK